MFKSRIEIKEAEEIGGTAYAADNKSFAHVDMITRDYLAIYLGFSTLFAEGLSQIGQFPAVACFAPNAGVTLWSCWFVSKRMLKPVLVIENPSKPPRFIAIVAVRLMEFWSSVGVGRRLLFVFSVTRARVNARYSTQIGRISTQTRVADADQTVDNFGATDLADSVGVIFLSCETIIVEVRNVTMDIKRNDRPTGGDKTRSLSREPDKRKTFAPHSITDRKDGRGML